MYVLKIQLIQQFKCCDFWKRASSLTLRFRARINLPRFQEIQVKNPSQWHFGRVWLTILEWEDDSIFRFWVFFTWTLWLWPIFQVCKWSNHGPLPCCDLKNHPTAGKHANDDVWSFHGHLQLDKCQLISQAWTWQTLKNQQKGPQDSVGGFVIFC